MRGVNRLGLLLVTTILGALAACQGQEAGLPPTTEVRTNGERVLDSSTVVDEAVRAEVDAPSPPTSVAPSPPTPAAGGTGAGEPASPAAARGPHAQHDPHGSLGPEAMVKVALQHQEEGRPAEALRTLDEGVARFERDAELRAVRGSLLLASGQVARALEDLELAHKLRPGDAAVLTNRAQAYRRFGRQQEALADLDRAVELDPDLLAARFNRGAMLHAQGEYERALTDFDQCIALDPHAPAAYFNRASTHEALGARDRAVADLQRFKELTDNPEWQGTADQLLQVWGATPAESATDGQARAGNP